MMSKIVVLIVLVAALVGCGGPVFTEADSPATVVTDARGTTVDAGGGDAQAAEAAAEEAGSEEAGSDEGGGSGSSGGNSSSGGSSSSSSSGGSTEAGAVSSSSSGGATADAGPCDGGSVYTHQVGVDGLTWQDCVPTGTYTATQALAACEAYAASLDVSADGCSLPPGTCEFSSEFTPPHAATATTYFWTYSGQTEATGTGHVTSVAASIASGGSGCPTATAPTWD
jgi:hypothetical protein